MKLTDRERQIVALIDQGLSTEEIAERLGIGKWTVKGHVRTLCRIFDCPMRDLPTAVRTAA